MTASTVQKLCFGNKEWHLAHSKDVQRFPANGVESTVDLKSDVAKALGTPLEFPSLDQAVVPGDLLAFAIDPMMPQMASVVENVVGWFVACGTSLANIRAVLADNRPEVAKQLREALDGTPVSALEIELHDPDDSEGIAYVAATKAGDPIYMNRTLVDADVVIPMTCARSPTALDYLGAYSIYPMLTDRATRSRIYSLNKLEQSGSHSKLADWADQAAWWLGLLAAVHVIPAGKDQIASVLAGAPDALETRCQEVMSAQWTSTPDPSDLVIALLDGPDYNQTWMNIARTLFTAEKCVAHGGTIVICSELSESIGGGLKRIRQPNKSAEEIAKQLINDKYDDSLAAAEILHATRDAHVYLHSQLRKDSVESLGLGAIESEEQLQQLFRQHKSCAIIDSAQHFCVK